MTADGKTAASWGEGQKTQKKLTLMGPNWVGPWALVERLGA